MPDLVLIARSTRASGGPALPRAGDPFWAALRACGLIVRDAPPPTGDELRRAGIEVLAVETPKVDPSEIDRDAAVERARETFAASAERLERRVAALRPRVVGILGAALHDALLGERARDAFGDDDAAYGGAARARRRRPADYGGARAFAIPGASPRIAPTVVLESVRELARELARLRGAATA